MLKQCTAGGGLGDAEMNLGMFWSVFFTHGCHFGLDPAFGIKCPYRTGSPDPFAVVGEFPGVDERFRLCGFKVGPFPRNVRLLIR
jgi:hypothetical protein